MLLFSLYILFAHYSHRTPIDSEDDADSISNRYLFSFYTVDISL